MANQNYDPYAGLDTPDTIAQQKMSDFQKQLQFAQPQNTGAMFGAQTQGMLYGRGLSQIADQLLPTDQMKTARANQQGMQDVAGMNPDDMDAYADMAARTNPQLADAIKNRANQLRADKANLVESAAKSGKDTSEGKLYDAEAEYYKIKNPGGTAAKAQKTTWGGTFDPSGNNGLGQYYTADGKPMDANDVQMAQSSYASRVADAQTTARAKALEQDFLKNGNVSAAVQYYYTTGKLPTGVANSRSPSIQMDFWKGVQDQAAATGNTTAGYVAQARMHQLAGQSAGQITTQLAQNVSFTNQMHKNIASVDQTMQALTGGNSRLANIIWQGVMNNTTTGEYAQLIARARPFVTSINAEASKIASGRVGSVGSLSDKQMAQQAENLNKAQNYDVWRTAANALQEEGTNRVNSLTQTQNDMAQYIQGGAGPKLDDQPPPGWENAPTLGPTDAKKLAAGTKYKTLDGRYLTSKGTGAK